MALANHDWRAGISQRSVLRLPAANRQSEMGRHGRVREPLFEVLATLLREQLLTLSAATRQRVVILPLVNSALASRQPFARGVEVLSAQSR